MGSLTKSGWKFAKFDNMLHDKKNELTRKLMKLFINMKIGFFSYSFGESEKFQSDH